MGGWFDLDFMQREDEVGVKVTALSTSNLTVLVSSQNEPVLWGSVSTFQHSQ